MANSFFGGKVHNIHMYDHVLNEHEILDRTEKMANNHYFIDTIYDAKFDETYYYVVHQLSNGNRQIVSRHFRNYASAEELMDELNEDLYTEDEE